MLDNCQLHSGRLNNVLGYNLTVTGSDGKHDTVTSQVRIDFHKFSEVAVEQTVILRLETAQSDQVAAVVTGLLAGDDSVQLLSLSQSVPTGDNKFSSSDTQSRSVGPTPMKSFWQMFPLKKLSRFSMNFIKYFVFS